MAKTIMIQGTMSGAGKSLLCAGLCRIFKQDGYKVAPFKSQNMALNSFITRDGLEMGRAQAVQAEAAGTEPAAEMNPILLKPVNDTGSQVIVNGEVLGNMGAREYFAYKKKLVPDIMRAFRKLDREYDIIVIEGAGSPAEINLKAEDIVNMGLAKLTDSPVLLVGDIDRGGVFAQLLGTIMLLEEEERARIKGLIINKFRGDKTILDPGIVMLEERAQIPVVGVAPYLPVEIEEEDSLTERFSGKWTGNARMQIRKEEDSQTEHFSGKEPGNVCGMIKKGTENTWGQIEIAVILLPRISNFTDFMPLENREEIAFRYVRKTSELGRPDMILLPGTKNTMGDLLWMRQNGLEAAILRAAGEGAAVFGICGGYQMLGETLSDTLGIEAGGTVRGMGLLPAETVFTEKKVRTRVTGEFSDMGGTLGCLRGVSFEGYEIHMGETKLTKKSALDGLAKMPGMDAGTADDMVTEKSASVGLAKITDTVTGRKCLDGMSRGNVYGTYVHGIFDKDEVTAGMIRGLAKKKGLPAGQCGGMDYRQFKEKQYDLLAAGLREHLDLQAIRRIMGLS